jgi:hypothetical protein
LEPNFQWSQNEVLINIRRPFSEMTAEAGAVIERAGANRRKIQESVGCSDVDLTMPFRLDDLFPPRF